jgi:hypothetical protein
MTKDSDRRGAVLRDLERSGLSMAEYCRRAGLTYGTVAAWRCAQRRKTARFIEVEEVESTGSAPAPDPGPGRPEMLCAELLLPGGAVLRVYTRGGEGGVQ